MDIIEHLERAGNVRRDQHGIESLAAILPRVLAKYGLDCEDEPDPCREDHQILSETRGDKRQAIPRHSQLPRLRRGRSLQPAYAADMVGP